MTGGILTIIEEWKLWATRQGRLPGSQKVEVVKMPSFEKNGRKS